MGWAMPVVWALYASMLLRKSMSRIWVQALLGQLSALQRHVYMHQPQLKRLMAQQQLDAYERAPVPFTAQQLVVRCCPSHC